MLGGEGRINYLVVLADAGTHTSWQGWIPAFAESTPPSTPLGYNNILGGGMTKGEENGSPFLSSSRMRGPIRRGKTGFPPSPRAPLGYNNILGGE